MLRSARFLGAIAPLAVITTLAIGACTAPPNIDCGAMNVFALRAP